MRVGDGLFLLGVRHHGPGSAASCLAALASIRPDVVLIEGPAEADAIAALAAHPDMRPPVAQLIYAPDAPGDGVFYPYSEFSPEWQALCFALRAGIETRFCDLPQRHALALARAQRSAEAEPRADGDDARDDADAAARDALPADPLDLLAAAAGFGDGERWWEHIVEHRAGDLEVFDGVGAAMAATRDALEASGERPPGEREALREAWMRSSIRRARKDGFCRIAVVCGAWHVPALAAVDTTTRQYDSALLTGLPAVRTSAAWVPWTHGRLSSASGYRAGVTAPGWYLHLWRHRAAGGDRPRRVGVRWLARAATLLRAEGIDVATANVIEAVRLAETLAALRAQPLPGLDEFDDAMRSALCFGDDARLRLIRRSLLVDDALGAVPADAPVVPLAADLAAQQKTLRMKPQAEEKRLDLDLRQPNGLARSRLLHRLLLLGIPWGERVEAGGKGTFKESWTLRWQPEFAVRLIEVSVYGSTVALAADRASRQRLADGAGLDVIVAALSTLLLADLPDAAADAIRHLQQRAALSGDLTELMAAAGPLARVLRYSDVRNTDAATLRHVVDGLCARICAGLAAACRALDDDAARALVRHIDAVDDAVALLERPPLRQGWTDALRRLDADGVHPLPAGRAARLLFDADAIDAAEAGRRLRFALSRASEPAAAAGWLEGFLAGGGALLLHDNALWTAIDDWLLRLPEDTFTRLLPLLRRGFARSSPAGGRRLLDRARRGGAPAAAADAGGGIDIALADAALPLLARLLGPAEKGAA